MKKEGLEAVCIIIGTVIGAGVLGIPYVIAKAGFLIGLIQLVIIGLLVLFMNLFLGEVVLRTNGNHQLTGYVEIYLGKTFKFLMFLSMVLGIYGALIAYLIGEGASLSAIFSGNPLIYSIIFFIIVTFIVHKGIKTLAGSEFIMSIVTLMVIFVIIILSSQKFNINNLVDLNIPMIFLPYGAILFAYLGTVSIPEVKEELIKNRKLMKRAIIIGSLIPIFVYVLFALFIVGATGIETTEISTIGLGNLLGLKMIILGNLFAIFAMFTSFIALAYALKEMYQYDYKLSKSSSLILTCLVPFIIFLLIRDFTSFIDLISITGALFGGLDGILIVLMYWKAKKMSQRKPEYSMSGHYLIGCLIMLIFFVGIILTLSGLFKQLL